MCQHEQGRVGEIDIVPGDAAKSEKIHDIELMNRIAHAGSAPVTVGCA
jgi:hypothetical protein